MTIQELIQQLAAHPPNYEVVVCMLDVRNVARGTTHWAEHWAEIERVVKGESIQNTVLIYGRRE